MFGDIKDLFLLPCIIIILLNFNITVIVMDMLNIKDNNLSVLSNPRLLIRIISSDFQFWLLLRIYNL